ncbi:MAG: InlB B-repeat-containing protein, partial [Bacteroidales bacterium]|nr:InlB B-repeat-containing protein [Bacteroidales bacterium]
MNRFLKNRVVPVLSALFTTILFFAGLTSAFAGDIISSVTCNGNVFTVTRDDANGPAIAYFRTQDLTALDGIHYIGATGFVEFANGEKTKNIVVSELTPAVTDINRYIYFGKSRKYMMFVWNNASTKTCSCIRTIPTNADNAVNADIIYNSEVSALVSSQNEGVYYKSGEDYRYSYKDKYIPLTKLTTQFSLLRKNYLNALNQEYQYQLRLHFLAQPMSTTNEGYCYVQLFTGTEGDVSLNNSSWQNVYGSTWSSSTNILGNFMFYISKSYGEDNGNIAADEGQEFCVPVKGVPNLRTTDLTNAWKSSNYWNYNTNATLKEQRSKGGKSSSDNSSGYVEISKETQSIGVRVASMGMYNTSTSKYDWYNWRFAAPTYYLRVYDDIAPKIVGVHLNTSESYKTGDELRVSIEFDEIVDLYSTNYLVLYARINGVRYTLDYAEGDRTNVINFTTKLKEPTSTSVSGIIIDSLKNISIANSVRDLSGNSVENGKYIINKTISNFTLSKTYNVTYENVGSTTDDGYIRGNIVTTYKYGKEVTLPTDVVRDGYTFGGWYTSSSFTDRIYSISSTTSGNKTYYAKWIPNTYSVALHANGGVLGVDVTSYNTGSLITLPTATQCARNGYTFAGWYATPDYSGSRVLNIEKTFYGNKEYYAQWIANSFSVTLDNSQATTAGTTSVSATYDATLPTIVLPTKTGYSFRGYYTSANGIGTQYYTAGGRPTKDLCDLTEATTLYAYWTPRSYTLTLDDQDATVSGSQNVVVNFDEVLPSISVPSKTGYTFGGYYSEMNGTGTKYYTEFGVENGKTWTTDSNGTLYANWTANTYTIAYEVNGGNIASDEVKTYTYGIGATLPSTVTKEGYEFQGWFATSYFDGEVRNEVTTTDLGNKTFYAKWKNSKYAITLNTNGGNINTGNVTEYTYGVTAVLPTNVTREGYTFTGWYTTEDCTGDVVSIISSTTVGDQTYYAGWANSAYTVTLNTNDGIVTTGNVTSYVFGTEKDLPSAEQITKNGYTFAGWYDNSSYMGVAVTKIPATATGNKNFWAKWTVNVYEITLNTNEGSINSGNVTNYVYGNGANLPSDVTKTGYKFAGWYNVTDSTKQVVRIDEETTGDQAFFAKWTAN